MTTPPVLAPDPFAALPPVMRWLFERCKPTPEAAALIDPALSLESLYQAWTDAKLLPDVIRLTSAVLPERESIWWGWVSARHASQANGGKPPSAAEHRCLASVERWIVAPGEESRRVVWADGNEAGLDTPIGMVSAAVFLSGSSVAPAGSPAVPPPPGTAMPLVVGAILLSATTTSVADQVIPTMTAFAAQGLEIVKRLGGWDKALEAAHDRCRRQQEDYDKVVAKP